jgi:hypothetical protein
MVKVVNGKLGIIGREGEGSGQVVKKALCSVWRR